MMKPRIVILGAGFGGLYTYLNLRKLLKPGEAEILLVNKTNYFLFTPMLHEVATGGLNQQHVIESIRDVIRKDHVDLLQANVESLQLHERIVYTSEGAVPYDYLVIALGATTNFYGIPGAEEHCFALKDIVDAHAIRNMCIDAFERASTMTNSEERRQFLTFGIIGGGGTGVELAAEMAELCFITFEQYYTNIYCPQEASLALFSSGTELLPQFLPKLRKKAFEILTKKGVSVMLNMAVNQVTEEGVWLQGGKFIPVRHKIWVAGVKPNLPPSTPAMLIDTSGRIDVQNTLQVPQFPNVFVLGDDAHIKDKHGNSIPMMAQAAVREAQIVAFNIAASLHHKPLRSFEFRPLGYLISLGQWKAIGVIFGIPVGGMLAWFIWRMVYLFKFASWAKRIKIAVDWTVNIFYPRDIAKSP